MRILLTPIFKNFSINAIGLCRWSKIRKRVKKQSLENNFGSKILFSFIKSYFNWFVFLLWAQFQNTSLSGIIFKHLKPSSDSNFKGPQSLQPYSMYWYFVLLLFKFDLIMSLMKVFLKPACLENSLGPLSNKDSKNFYMKVREYYNLDDSVNNSFSENP